MFPGLYAKIIFDLFTWKVAFVYPRCKTNYLNFSLNTSEHTGAHASLPEHVFIIANNITLQSTKNLSKMKNTVMELYTKLQEHFFLLTGLSQTVKVENFDKVTIFIVFILNNRIQYIFCKLWFNYLAIISKAGQRYALFICH